MFKERNKLTCLDSTQWPSLLENDDNEGEVTAAFNASSWIMHFFSKHSLPLTG